MEPISQKKHKKSAEGLLAFSAPSSYETISELFRSLLLGLGFA